MKRHVLVFCCLLLFTGITIGQFKQAQVAKPVVYQLQKLLTGIKLPYKIINDSMASGVEMNQNFLGQETTKFE